MAAPNRKRLNVEGLSDLVRLHLDSLKAESARLDGISADHAGRLLGLGRLGAGERAMLADVLQARRWTPERRRRWGRRITLWRPRTASDGAALLQASTGCRENLVPESPEGGRSGTVAISIRSVCRGVAGAVSRGVFKCGGSEA